MDRALASVSGLLLWAIVLVVPTSYLSLWRVLGTAELVLLAIPVLVLLVALERGSRPAAVLGFPLSLLPLLVTRPELTGPRIYGAAAFLAVLAATGAYLVATVRGTARTPRLTLRPLVVMGALALAFAVPAAALHFDLRLRMRVLAALGPHDGRVLALCGLVLFAAWAFGVWRHAIRGLGSAWLRPESAVQDMQTFRAIARLRPRTRLALASALITAISAALALVAYLRHNP